MSYDEEPDYEGDMKREFDKLKARLEGALARGEKAEAERDEARATMLVSNANALRAQHDATDGDERWAREQARIKALLAEQTARAEGLEGALDVVRRSLDAYRDALAIEQVTSRAAEVFAAESETEKWRIWATIIHRDLDLPPFDNNRLRDITRRVARPSMVADMQTREPSEFPYVYRDSLDACEAERDQAIAACAEMRALLERGVCQGHDSGCNPVETYNGCAARALLARPDLGAGMVVVPREVVERWRGVIVDGWAGISSPKVTEIIADLDALLKQGGG